MSATAPRPQSVTRGRTPARRRVSAIVALVVCGVAALLVAPLFEKAIQKLSLPLEYQSIIRQQAAEKGLDPALVAAVIYAETGFNARTSPTGAEGLMQMEPATATFLAHRSGGTSFRVSDLGTPAVNIAYGTYYLRYLLDEYGGNMVLALAAYNAGETNVNGWLDRARAAGRSFTTEDIPFPQTRAYVLKVLQARQDYRNKYARQLGYN